MTDEMYKLFKKALDKYPDAMLPYSVLEDMWEYERERNKDKQERRNKMQDMIRCKDCKFNVLSGCHYLKDNIKIYFRNGMSINQEFEGNTYIPDPNFSCSSGQPKEGEMSSALHAKLQAPPLPKKDVKDLSTLDILLHKALSISSPEVSGALQTKNDIAYVLQELIRYLMIEKTLA